MNGSSTTLDSQTEKQKMLAGVLYHAMDPELVADRQAAETVLLRFNATADPDHRRALLQSLLASIGPSATVRPPFFCDYGYNIHLGRDVFLNFNCVLLDVMPIHIGDRTQIGPAVQIYAADHPRHPDARRAGLECARPVTIGQNVWIGGGAIILPGITIGDNAIIGAGSVITRNVPAGRTVAGNPVRPLREPPNDPASPHNPPPDPAARSSL